MNQNLKKHLISGLHTFLTAFGLAVYPMISTVDLSQGVTKALVFAILAVGIRAGIKSVWIGLVQPAIDRFFAKYSA